jgi:glycosyltransferase involved in cell wall biosynthesis
MKALFLTSTFYESIFKVGDHHLADQFALHGWQVGYISTPVTPFHILAGLSDSMRTRFDNYRSDGKIYPLGAGSIWSYVPGAIVSPRKMPLLNSHFIYEHWIHLTIPQLKKKLYKTGFNKVDLIYFSSPIFSSLLKTVQYRQSIFRIADQEAGYKHFTKQDHDFRMALAQAVDLVIYSAHTMEKEIKRLHPKRSLHIPNGVQLEYFINQSPQRPKEYEGITNPIVIYVGAMRYWFDTSLLNQITKALPQVNFVLIGPNNEVRKHLEFRDNLHLLGEKSYRDLPKFLYNADVGIIPFNQTEYPLLVNRINPLKLYEYTACGLPVVATRWEELEKINSPAKLCNNPQEFISAIQQSLNVPHDRDVQVDFVKRFDWQAQYDKLIKALLLI